MISTGEYNKSQAVRYIADTLKQLLNFVEDRRIDYYIYKNAISLILIALQVTFIFGLLPKFEKTRYH